MYSFRAAISPLRTVDSGRALTTFVLGDDIRDGTYDAKIISNRLLARQGIYPAFDTLRSSSTVSTDKSIGGQRIAVASAAKAAIDAVIASFYEGALGDPNWIFNADMSKNLSGNPFKS